MEQFNNILCITGTELILSESNPDGLMSIHNYRQLSQRSRINVIRRGCYGNPALVEYDTLPIKYKQMYEDKFGDPRKRAAVEPFLRRIKPDARALQFFTDYRYGENDNDSLSIDKIKSYCNDVMILNALGSIIAEATTARKAFGGKIPNLWGKALGLVDSVREFYPCNLPKRETTLKRKYDRYIAEGYYAVIHAGLGNQNTSKVKDEIAEAYLTELLSHGNQLAAPQVCETYNLWAKSTDRSTITEGTVNNFRIKHEYEISCSRNGKDVWANKYDQVIRRSRPSAPLLLVNSDDNDLDLFFRAEYTTKKNGKFVTIKNDYYRFKLYVVLDAHCDYILGYAFGDQITKEVIHSAFRNAIRHIKELTGSYYLWDQLVADRWGTSQKSSQLREYFEAISKFTPPTAGLARSKVIERSFGSEWHRELKRYKNYCGHNITAKSKTNRDFIQSNIKTNPTIEEGKALIAQFIERMRMLQWKESGMSRQQVWINNFKQIDSSRERLIGTETYLTLFGDQHKYSNRITNGGLTITIDNEQYRYDIPENIYRSAVGKKVQVYYEAEDMSRVLVTDGAKLRFVATENVPMPMALADMQDGDRTRLNDILDIKKTRREQIKKQNEQRSIILETAKIDPQALLQAGILEKEILQHATAMAAAADLGGKNELYSLV